MRTPLTCPRCSGVIAIGAMAIIVIVLLSVVAREDPVIMPSDPSFTAPLVYEHLFRSPENPSQFFPYPENPAIQQESSP